MIHVYEKELQVAIDAARDAGKLLLDGFNKPHEITSKTPRDFLTEMDTASEQLIISRLRKSFPGYSVLAEESGKSEGNDFVWIIDPLDGTTNYSIKNPFFDISIALALGEDIVLGVVYSPFTGEMFTAIKGQGAFLNGKTIGVSRDSLLKDMLLAYCNGSSDMNLEEIVRIFQTLKPLCKDFSRMRAGALELALVAAGRLGAYISNGVNLWDVAAGKLLVEEAGGKVTDFLGRDFGMESGTIVASNGIVHEEIVRILREIK